MDGKSTRPIPITRLSTIMPLVFKPEIEFIDPNEIQHVTQVKGITTLIMKDFTKILVKETNFQIMHMIFHS